jgi:hypothetical protein
MHPFYPIFDLLPSTPTITYTDTDLLLFAIIAYLFIQQLVIWRELYLLKGEMAILCKNNKPITANSNDKKEV